MAGVRVRIAADIDAGTGIASSASGLRARRVSMFGRNQVRHQKCNKCRKTFHQCDMVKVPDSVVSCFPDSVVSRYENAIADFWTISGIIMSTGDYCWFCSECCPVEWVPGKWEPNECGKKKLEDAAKFRRDTDEANKKK